MRTPIFHELNELRLVPQLIGINLVVRDVLEDSQHVIHYFLIAGPHVTRIECATAIGVSPGQQEVGYFRALTGIAHRVRDKAIKSGFFFDVQRFHRRFPQSFSRGWRKSLPTGGPYRRF